MNISRLIGLGLVVCGVAVFLTGLDATDSTLDQFSHFFTGHFSDSTVWTMLAGVACMLLGLVLTFARDKTAAP